MVFRSYKRKPFLEKTNENLTMAEKITKKYKTRSNDISTKNSLKSTKSDNKRGDRPSIPRRTTRNKENESKLSQNESKIIKNTPKSDPVRVQNVQKRSPLIEKRLSPTQKPKTPRVSLTYDPLVEEKVLKLTRNAKKRAQSLLKNVLSDSQSPQPVSKLEKSTVDPYDFEIDPSEEQEILKKKKLKEIIDESGDFNNSMKDVVKKIRKKELQTKVQKKQRAKRVKSGTLATKNSPTKSEKTKIRPKMGIKSSSEALLRGSAVKSDSTPKKGPQTPTKSCQTTQKGPTKPEKSKIHRERVPKSSLDERNVSGKAKQNGGRTRNDCSEVKLCSSASKTSQDPTKSFQTPQKGPIKTVKAQIHPERGEKSSLEARNVPGQAKNDCSGVKSGGSASKTTEEAQSCAKSVQSGFSFVENPNLTLSEQIIQSFQDDFCETDTFVNSAPNNGQLDRLKSSFCAQSVQKSPKINVISNVVLEKSDLFDKLKDTSVRNVNKMAAVHPVSRSPWRLNVVNRNPHTFVVKNDSFTPSYDQDIVINSTLVERFPKSTHKTVEIPKEPSFQQTSILSYVNSPLNTTLFTSPRKDLNTTLFTSPRKVLSEINYQSTPFINKSNKKFDPDVSQIPNEGSLRPNLQEKKPCQESSPNKDQSGKKRSTLFGFTINEDDESKENATPNKRTARVTPKKKTKKVLFNEEVKEAPAEPEVVDEVPDISSADVEMLFQDVEDDHKLEVKRSRFSYESKRPKRKRYPSWNESEVEIDTEDEVEEENRKRRKHNKTTQKRSKHEEEEIDKLAAHYNSMFEEIEHHDLLIE